MAETTSKSGVERKTAKAQAEDVQNQMDNDVTEAGLNEDQPGTLTDAVVVKDTDKIEGVYDETSGETLVTLNKDVVEEFYYPNTKRPAYRVLFSKGQTVPKSTIDALNAGVEQKVAAAKRAEAGEETPLEEYVDSTTLASGTGANAATDKK